MKRRHIRDWLPKNLYDDLVNRRKTVREIAKEVGVSENYLSHAIPERAPKRNPKLLKVTRRLYKLQVAREANSGRHNVAEAAKLACVSERTMYRLLQQVRTEAT